jgi:hypothetical protein
VTVGPTNTKTAFWIRNILITLGVVYLSFLAEVLPEWLFGKLNSGIVYGGGLLDAIAMGVMTSMGRAVAAGLAATAVALLVESRKPQRWVFIVAILYAVEVPRPHWHVAPRVWDQLWQSVDAYWPPLVCVVVAFCLSKFRLRSGEQISKRIGWTIAAAFLFTAVCAIALPKVMLHSRTVHRITVEDIRKQLQNGIPPGASRSTVEVYLDSQKIAHSYIDDPRYSNERRVEYAWIRDSSHSWLVRGDISIRFRFDESDHVVDYEVREMFTGP